MRHVAMQPTETTSDVTFDACCQSTSIEGYGQQFGVLCSGLLIPDTHLGRECSP